MPADQVPSWHRQWLALDDARVRYLDAWSILLTHLERKPGWFALSDEARAEAERTSGLSDLDAQLRAIDRRLRRWQRFMPTTPSRDVGGVIANLHVAERLLAPEENLVVHGLIDRAARDLARIRHQS
jgi:hypothetical protein